MMSVLFFVFAFLFMSLLTNFYSFLNSLLILESCSLVLFFLSVYLMILGLSLKFLLYYFVFIVSESATGLSILVLILKSFGSGNFRSMTILQF